jgi:hypothetical protein
MMIDDDDDDDDDDQCIESICRRFRPLSMCLSLVPDDGSILYVA